MNVLTEGLARTAGYIVSEAHGYRSRQQAWLASGGAVLLAGAVLSLLAVNTGAVTVGTAVFTGTGNGVLTKANPAYGAGALEGTYKVQLIDEGTNAGDFVVVRPDGTIDGYASVGVAYDGQVKFTIADGATDFASPAVFALPVTIADPTDVGKYVAYDGTKPAAAILFEGRDASGVNDVRCTITARDSEVQIDALVWAEGVTSDQKTAALASLAALGIIGR